MTFFCPDISHTKDLLKLFPDTRRNEKLDSRGSQVPHITYTNSLSLIRRGHGDRMSSGLTIGPMDFAYL